MIDLLNAGDIDGAMNLVALDFKGEDVALGELVEGREGVRAQAKGWLTAIAGAQQQFTNIVSAGDQIVVEGTLSGIHAGTLEAKGKMFPKTGRRVAFRFCTIAKIRDGLVAAETHYYDLNSLLEQLNGAQLGSEGR
jgi:predicted ester cyclase